MPDQVLSLDSLIGVELSHYRIIQEIGSGGMGVVFRAHDEHLDREVAIKVLHPGTITDEGARKHLRKEALALSKLNHPNIATIYDFDTQRGIDFLVMEYIPGVTLNVKLAAGPLPENDVLRLGMQLSDGLAAAHEHGVVHRDLKPGNLRLASDGRLKILDFGLAKLRQSLTESAPAETTLQTQAISGTFAYIAPEQLMGEELDARTDIHGAGLVLYEMATGQRAFAEVQSGQLIGAILRRSPAKPRTLNPRVSSELERIIGKCLEKDPQNRYQTAKELAVDLSRLLQPATAGVQTRPRPRWARMAIAAGLFAALAVLAVVATILVPQWRSQPAARSRPEIKSLAVLPLANMSGDPNQEYFADGMTEQLITDLARLGKFKVISRTSVLRYKGTTKPMEQIAKELGVDAVLEGSVVRSGDRVRISVQLVHGATDTHLWAERYERDLRDIFALQREISTASTRAIGSQLAKGERPPPRQRVAPEAYEAYLRARYATIVPTPSGLAKCSTLLERAISLEPAYAEAYGALAECYTLAGIWGEATREVMPKAKAAAEKAISLDDSVAAGHAGLARVRLFYDWDMPGAEREFWRAIELDPSRSETYGGYAALLAYAGRFDEAITAAKRAVELDPLNPYSHFGLGWAYFYAGRYQESIVPYQKSLELDPNSGLVYPELGWAYAALGRKEEARQACRRSLQLSTHDAQVPLASCAYVFGRVGPRKDALRYQQELLTLAKRTHVDPYNIALAYAATEDKRALDWLERAYAEHNVNMPGLGVEVLLPDSIRSDPRYQDLLRRMNFPP